MGGGKTLLSLSLLRYRKQCGERVRAIVFVPYITSVETWVEEVKKHTPDLVCVPLVGSTRQNQAALDENGDVFVICYQSAVAMVCQHQSGKWTLQASDVKKYFSAFNMAVFDEIHRAKSASSLTYRMCRAVSQQCAWVFGLTGTPFGRDLSDLWAQFYLIDFGQTLGPTLGLFREVFFSKKMNYWGGYEYTFKKARLPALKRLIKNRSIHYSPDEFYDMPGKQYIERVLNLPESSLGYSQRLEEQLQAAIKNGNRDSYRVVESSYLQLQQLGSGFLTLKGEDSSRVQVSFDENPKLDELAEILEGMPPDCKAVVFHHFIYTSQLISERLKGLKIKHARIWSGQRDPIGQLRMFKDEPSCTTLVINCKSGSSSLNLQGANYLIFFEQPQSPIDRQQAEARCWRPGQTKRVFIYDFLMRGTVDARQHKANQAGESLLKSLLQNRR